MADGLSTEQALVRSVHSLDAARRVGWAKAYEAEERIDELSGDYNRARDDRENFKSGLSFLWGFTMGWFKGESPDLYRGIMKEVLKYEATLDPKLIGKGLVWARSARKKTGAHDDDVKRNERDNRAFMDDLKYRASASVAAKYGFRTIQEMEDLLARYQAAKGWHPWTFQQVVRASALADAQKLMDRYSDDG